MIPLIMLKRICSSFVLLLHIFKSGNALQNSVIGCSQVTSSLFQNGSFDRSRPRSIQNGITGFLAGVTLLCSAAFPSCAISDSIVFDSMDDNLEWDDEWVVISKSSRPTTQQLRSVPERQCKISTKKGDILAIEYVAKRLGRPDKETDKATVYDASLYRGTGNDPFYFVLGSGVMIPGVDMSLYDMCPGEIRVVKVPPTLAAGLLDPIAKSPVEWKVELVSIDGIVRQDNNDEMLREERILRSINEQP